ncbi:MAG: MFS transporter [bacterium]|nr:MFS transporter [bacterium]
MAREAAVVLLQNVLTNRRPLDEILLQSDKVPELAHLAKADRGFARAIAATALRRHGQLLDVIGQFMEKGIPDRAGPLREILISAAAQLLFLDSPPHAVLNIAVQQVKRDHNSRRYDKLANAVLRRVSEKGPDLIKAQDAGRLNTPNWLWNSWCKAYDKQTAKYIAEAHLHQAQLDLSVVENPDVWAKKLGGALLPTGSIRLKHKGRIENIEGFEDGAWWVQDAAAALPVKLLGDIKGKRVADLAAAPGGKSAQMAAQRAKVTALDWSVGRLKRLQENFDRLELEADIVCGDILDWQPDELFDAVLLDAPCTSTGTIRRHPDLPYLKRQSDIEELGKIQARLLDKALVFVKPGGTLIYCTCSLQPEEGEQQIAALLKRNKKVKLDIILPEELAGRDDWITPQGTLRTLPYHRPFDKAEFKKVGSGMDGFFAARILVS